MTRNAWIAVCAAALAAFAFDPGPARAEVAWLCHPALAGNPCEIPLDTTVQEPGGAERVVVPNRPPQGRRPADCFYVYPTVSNQITPLATKSRDPELLSIAKYQAARFSQRCRMFAPIYRQRTVPGLLGNARTDPEIPYSDVAEAFREYLRSVGRKRGFALVGHSQGTRMLRLLIRREVDPSPRLCKRFVGGFLLGGNVTVAKGRARGGDFEHVPVCTRRGQFGCIVAYSTFSEDPPSSSRYGRAPAAPDELGFPGGPGYRVACTDPGRLSGIRRPVGATTPTEPFALGFIALTILQTYGGLPPSAPTTFITPPDRFAGSCRTIGGARVYRYEPVGDSRRPNPSPEPGWGTHVIDMNLGTERLVRILGIQARAWKRAQRR